MGAQASLSAVIILHYRNRDVEISAEILNRAMVSAVPARLYVGPDQDQIQGKRGKAKQYSFTHILSFLVNDECRSGMCRQTCALDNDSESIEKLLFRIQSFCISPTIPQASHVP